MAHKEPGLLDFERFKPDFERFKPGEDLGLVDPTWRGGAHRLSAPSISEHGGTIGLLTGAAGLGLGAYRLGLLGYQGIEKGGQALDRILPALKTLVKRAAPVWGEGLLDYGVGKQTEKEVEKIAKEVQEKRLRESAKKLGADPDTVLGTSSNIYDFPPGGQEGLLEDFGPNSAYWRWLEDPSEEGDISEIYRQIYRDFGPYRGNPEPSMGNPEFAIEHDLSAVRTYPGYTETDKDQVADRTRFNVYRAIVRADQAEDGITNPNDQLTAAYNVYSSLREHADMYWVREIEQKGEPRKPYWSNNLGVSLNSWRERTFLKNEADVRKLYIKLKNTGNPLLLQDDRE